MPRGTYGKSLATDIATATVEHEGLMTPTQAAMLLNLDTRADALALVRAKQSGLKNWDDTLQTLASGTLGAGFWLVWGTAQVYKDSPATEDYVLELALVTEFESVKTTKFLAHLVVPDGLTGDYVTITTPPVAVSLTVESSLLLRGRVVDIATPFDHAYTGTDNATVPQVVTGFQAVRLAETPLE